MRGTFGVHVAKIAAEFKLDVEDRLAEILPARRIPIRTMTTAILPVLPAGSEPLKAR